MQNAEPTFKNTEAPTEEENISEGLPADVEPEAEDNITSPEAEMQEQKSNKQHLTSSVPRVARVPRGALTKGEMAEIREIFGDMDDAEIQRLYKRVTK